MPRRTRKQNDSNLFAIDFDYIETVLQEANAKLISSSENILDEGSVIEGPISSNAEAAELKSLVTNLRANIKEVGNARLSDGRPFSEASKVVKEWFGKTETRLKALDKRLSGILSEYTASVAREAEAVRQRNAEIERIARAQEEAEAEAQEKTIGVTVDGTPIISATLPIPDTTTRLDPQKEPEPEVPDVALEWRVKNYSIENLNLNDLAQYFSDYGIMTALNNHLKANGPNILEGVTYEQVVAKKL